MTDATVANEGRDGAAEPLARKAASIALYEIVAATNYRMRRASTCLR